KIAKENAVAETAFFIKNGNSFDLRWFTPDTEMDLCGHATLATAHCLKSILNYSNDKIVFETLSGDLNVSAKGGFYFLDFPSRTPKIAALPEIIKESLSIEPKEIYKSRDYLLVYETEEDIRRIQINRQLFDQINLEPGGVIVTAKGDKSHFVSRFFTPQASILEDPVTGSAHCSLIPFWSKRLGIQKLDAIQVSDRGGILKCENKNDRVIIGGCAKTYSIGNLWIEQPIKSN
ncbi:MAG TPA: isomerase, partial [Cryomorphaceae bacterium]|nr:isomerase [Cryomorphaceae bacterium]